MDDVGMSIVALTMVGTCMYGYIEMYMYTHTPYE